MFYYYYKPFIVHPSVVLCQWKYTDCINVLLSAELGQRIPTILSLLSQEEDYKNIFDSSRSESSKISPFMPIC